VRKARIENDYTIALTCKDSGGRNASGTASNDEAIILRFNEVITCHGQGCFSVGQLKKHDLQAQRLVIEVV
jgi:hypothetical protein